MAALTVPETQGARVLRRVLPYAIAGLLAAGIMAGFNIAFAQEITSDAAKLDQGSNLIWMVGAFLVFFMQAGFAFLGAGLIRSKNTTNYMTKSFMDFGNADGSANVIPGHSVPFVVIGTFILFFGWFGFNINTGDSIGLNAINTLLAGATGSVVALYIQLMRTPAAPTS